MIKWCTWSLLCRSGSCERHECPIGCVIVYDPVGMTEAISEAFLVRLAGKPYCEVLVCELENSHGPRMLL